jgi:hypothetical protein
MAGFFIKKFDEFLAPIRVLFSAWHMSNKPTNIAENIFWGISFDLISVECALVEFSKGIRCYNLIYIDEPLSKVRFSLVRFEVIFLTDSIFEEIIILENLLKGYFDLDVSRVNIRNFNPGSSFMTCKINLWNYNHYSKRY